MAIGGNNTTATVTLNANMDPSGVLSAVKAMQGAFNNLKLPNNIGENLDKSLSKATELLKKYQSQLQKGINTKTDAKNISKTGVQINEVLDDINHYINELNGQQIFLKADVSGLNKLKTNIDDARTAWKNAIQEFRKGSDIDKVLNQIGEKTTRSNLTQGSISKAKTLFDKGDLEGYKNALDEIYNRLKSLKDTTVKNVTENLGLKDAGSKAANLEQIKKQLEAISKINFSNDANVKAQFDEITNSVSKYEAELKRAGNAGQEAFNDINAGSAINNTRALVDATDQYTNSIMSAKDQVQDLQRSTQYFFSLRNMINLFKRGIDDAIQSVKDLDKAMTDTAVVTDYKVSDMWNMLPEYTKLANELGATTQGAYETMTLYFQQGLDQQAAFEIGAETMKMARIAGLDYAETTDMMTAALRGFNMELNETSAKRINDVYSKLAAITASDTEELGTAMQRTASIAHSAGMSFEGTTAFLAQAIETTREPAENIGTAMKTIIARFQEMKKNPLEITEVEGEEVDFNKVDAALKTIGVDLKDTNGQFRELDKVFLDISQRWDGLTQTQQRYIATTAAGSRQQSRFIAMMDNYDRTMELVSAANNSAGASEEQFAKTADSLEFKLNQLHNAWQAFTMGIANNGMIKTAVDGITTLLTNINKLIDTFSFGIGPLKSFLSIFTAFTGLKAAGKIANAAIGGLGGMIDPQSTFGAGFGRGFLGNKAAGNAQLASQINQPIVAELRALRIQQGQQIKQDQQSKNGAYDPYNQFKTANQQIRELTGGKGYKVTDLKNILGSLDKGGQNQLMRHMSGTAVSTRNSLMDYYQKQNPLAAKGIKQQFGYLNNQRKIGELSWKEYYDTISDPELLKRGLDTSTEAGKAAERMLTGMAAKVNQKVDSAVRSQALESLSTNEDYKSLDRAGQQKMYQQEVDKLKADAENMSKIRAGVLDDMLPEIKNSKWAQRADSFGKMSAGLTSAGMGIQSFGNLLISSANPALQTFGSALVSVGGVVSSLGMGLGGLVSSFSAVAGSDLMGTVAKQIGVGAGALTAGLGVAAAAVAGIAWYIKKQRDDIRKDAEKVTTDYKEKNDKAQTNINNLQSYKEDFARLSAGVDANGYNINLSTEDYDRYLEISRELAEINPSIVAGYNAQGQAIISNNKALEETLALEKEHQQEAFKEYTSSDSTRKLQKALNLEKTNKYTDKKGNYTSGNKFYDSGKASLTGEGKVEKEYKPQATMRKEAQNIGKTLQKGIKEGWATEDLLSDFNIDIAKLAEGDEATLQKFDQLGPKIQHRINNAMDAAGDEIKDSTKESMVDAFSGYSDASEELDELIKPMYEQLMTKMAPYAGQIPDEFRQYFNQGLKDIASNANITDYDAEAQKLATEFSNLTAEGGEYQTILNDVQKAQDEYAATLNKDAYEEFINGTDGAIDRIKDLKQSLIDEGMDMTQGYGKAVSDFLDNEISKIENFTQEGAANLKHALNTMTDQIAAAEGTLESFNSIAEGSTYGKAASNMSQIFETATADEHILGQGDQAFWAGAEALVGRKNLLEGGDLTKDKALAQMKEVQEMLKGGQEGWDNFKTKWFENADANFKVLEDGSRRLLDKNGEIIEGLTLDDNNWFSEINEDLNPKVYEQIADALNMSKDSLVAMLNLGRQFGEVNFTNVGEVRKALATSDTTIKNADNGKVFVRRESLESEMTSAGIDLNKQQEIEKDLQDNYNTELIKEVGDITKDNQQFTAMGINNMESLVKTFEATGQFTKDEIQAYGEKWAEINNQQFNPEEFNRLWNENQTDQEFGGIPSSLTSIESILSSIEGILASQRLSEGYLDNATAKDAQKWLFGGEGEDTNAQQFWQGHGSGKNGEITTSEFNKTSKDLTDFIATSKNYVDQLKSAEKNAANETERQEIEAERKAYEYMVERAETYLKEGTEAYNNQIQSKIEGLQKDRDLVDQGFADLFSGLTPESINTDQAQSALNQLYEAAINNTPAVLTDGLMSQMQTLGIDIQKAIDAGLVVDSNKVWESAQNKGKEAADDVTEGAANGANSVDTSGSEAAGESKGKEAADKVVEGAKIGASNTDTSGAQQAGQEAAEETNEAYAAGTHQAAPGMPSNVPPNMTPAAPTSTSTETKVTVDDSELVTANQTAQDLNSTLSQGGQYNIQVTGADTLKQAASDARSITKNSGNKSVAVSASFDSGAVTKGLSAIKGMKAKMQVGATVDPAIAAARRAQRTIDSMKATIDVSTKVTGQNVHIYVTKHEKTVKSHTGGLIVPGGPIYRARGGLASDPRFKKEGTDTIPAMLTPGEYVQNRDAVQYFGVDFMRKINHKDLKGALQSFGSAAKGRRGRLGPDGNGGLTLTGEKGYEIAWIPSESRSIILGVNGPQMAELPSDAIIWDHKQSKKIMSQNAIPAGSHYVTSTGATRPGTTQLSTNNKGTNKQNKTDDKNDKNADKAKKVINNVGKVSAYWENIARQTEATQRLMDKNAKVFEKYVKEMRATLHMTGVSAPGGGGGDDYIASINKYKQLNISQRDTAANELKNASTSKSKTKISYKKGKKTKDKKVQLSKYIKYNDELGIYEINQDELNKVKNKNEAKAIKEAAEKKINEKQSKKNTAEDNIQKAEEALEKFREELYNSFFAWETELTKIWNITQKIAETEARINRTKSYTELLDAQISSGLQTATEEFAQQSIDAFSAGIYQQKESLKENIDALNQEREDLRNSLTLDDEKATLENIKTILTNDKNSGYKNLNDTQREGYYEWAERLEKKINVQDEAWKYLTVAQKDDGTLDVNFDNAKFKEAQTAGLINEETAKEIETYVKSLTDQSGAINERLDKINSSTAEFYTQLASLKDEWADYANQLWDISDAEQKKEIDELKKLSDSLDKAFKNLLDGVKRKLDERRQQEDNLKTEREISQKQQRLAMLQADTAGGHQTEIAQLQQEIANSQQDYQRTLEDQMLEKLQEQADIAIQQREQQITLQESTIDAINNAALVNKWLADPTNPANKQAMYEAFMAANEADKKPDAIKEQLERQFEALYLGITTNKAKQDALYTLEESKKSIINEIQNGTIKMSNWSGKDKGILDAINESINSINVGGASTSLSNPGGVPEGGVKTAVSQAGNGGGGGGNSGGGSNTTTQKAYDDFLYNRGNKTKTSDKNWGKLGKDGLKAQIARGAQIGKSEMQVLQDLANTAKLSWGKVIDAYRDLKGKKTAAENLKAYFGKSPSKERKAGWKDVFKKDYPKYKTGGLADYTGPAWLDGTPSKPELVLNATDTKNFIALKDVLSKAMGSTNAIENTYGGDTTFEININVDHLNNDYDVDKVAERVKKIIVKDSSYRNVTQVRNFR